MPFCCQVVLGLKYQVRPAFSSLSDGGEIEATAPPGAD